MASILTISPSPHVRSGMTTQKIMGLVILALVPSIAAATIIFGLRALLLVLFCAIVSALTEFVCQKLMKKEVTISDGSAVLTGVLLALNLPATLPLWEAAIGCIFAVAIVKQLFGGLGCNFANPAITGRIFSAAFLCQRYDHLGKTFCVSGLILWRRFHHNRQLDRCGFWRNAVGFKRCESARFVPWECRRLNG